MLLRKNIPVKYIIGKIKYELIFISTYATVIGLLDAKIHLENISVSTGVPMILGTIISLLLAFKSNQAYDRWWEARIIWGAIVNDSRSLARLILSLIRDKEFSVTVSYFKDRIIKRQIAWCYSLGYSLRKQDAFTPIVHLLSEDDLLFIRKHDNIPNALLQLQSMDIAKALENNWINNYQQIKLEQVLSRLCDSMGKCERIKNTIFPTTYSMYIHMALWLFILLFPFALTHYFGMFEIPLMISISSALLLIEKMAIHLQDPFENKPTDIPVTSIAATIERNLLQMVNEETKSVIVKEYDFYVL